MDILILLFLNFCRLKDLKEIREALDQRKITSEELTMTYIYQAATKGLEMEAIADINFEWAKAQAIKWDNDFYQGISKGPLHGIPISIKDTVNLAGTGENFRFLSIFSIY